MPVITTKDMMNMIYINYFHRKYNFISDFGLLVLHPNKSKNRSSKNGFIKWCAILCDYRINFYNDYKQLGYKLELTLGHE